MPLLDVDPLTNAVSSMDWDHSTSSLIIRREENVDDILAANHALTTDVGQAWRGEDNSMWHVASVPLTEFTKWVLEFNMTRAEGDKIKSYLDPNPEWEKFWWMRLQSSDYAKLKTAPVNL